MSTYDDWVVNFVVNTKPLDLALAKVNRLRNEINNLHSRGGLGGLGGRGGGSGGGGQGGNRQSSRMAEMYASNRHDQHNQRLRERYDRERARIQADFDRAYDRRAHIEQMRQLEMATMGARQRAAAQRERQRQMDRAEAAGHRENRWRNGQASAGEREARRSSNFSAAQRSREMQLSRLERRMGASGVGDRNELANIRERLGAARNQTDLNRLAPDMRNFVIQTNQAVNAQNRLQRQLDRNGFAVRAMSSSMANMARSYLSIYAVVGAASSMYKNMKELENLQTKLLMGTGSKGEALEAYDYIKARAKETGSDLSASTNLYAQMAITARDAGLNKSQIKKVYEDTTTMSIGYGLGADQQKLVTKAIIQMMSKGSVQAEEFRHQLGDQAPGVMNALQQVMGLKPGKEGMATLTKMMKKGQIPIEKLFEFLDLISKRAKETGAYDLALNSKTATENRMQTSYKLFSESFGRMFDQEIKAPFKGFEKFFDRMSTWIDEQEKLKKETGEIGKLETLVELFVVSFSDVTDLLSMVVEGLAGVLDKIPGMDFDLGKKLANRELENSYYDYKGAKSYADRQALSNSGMPGFEQFRKDMFFKAQPKATEADYARFSGKLGSSTVNSDAFSLLTNPIGSLVGGITNPRTMDNATSRVESLLADIASYTAFAKESAQNLYNKYSTPVTINIDGAQDPILIGNIVEQKIKEQTQIGR